MSLNMSNNYLKNSFKLPCGVTIKNRIVKSAITERVSNSKLEPNKKHHKLYKLWAKTGVGLVITGNVMVDELHRESVGNVYVGDNRIVPKLKEWVDIAKENDTQVWAQLSHAGRQTNKFLTSNPLAPSEVRLDKMGLFGKPKSMNKKEILDVVDKFVRSAINCKEAGFQGVQIHAAHGYLINQFLSPLTNLRKDIWGGTLENRSRLLLTIIEETRKALGDTYPISVKLNSSDFQKGAFSEEDSLRVIQMLEGKIDLLEISGGTYERLICFELNENSLPIKETTKKREAYFIEFAKKIRKNSSIPLLITGGFRTFDFCNNVLENNELDFIGMARPFITNFEDIPKFLENKIHKLDNLVIRTKIQSMDDSAEGGYYIRQVVRLAKGKKLDPKIKPITSSLFFIFYEIKKAIICKAASLIRN